MSTRRVAAVTALLLLGLAPHADAAKRDRCTVKDGTVLAKQGKVRVLQQGRDYYACNGKAKPFFLFDGATNEEALGLTLAGGRYVAFVDRRIAPVDGIPDVDLEVVDVRTKRRNRVPIGQSVGDPEDPAQRTVRLALTPTGVAALQQTGQLLVVSAKPRSTPVIVAYGDDITEVAAGPKTIYWQAGGTLHSTPAAAPVAAPVPVPAPTPAP